MAKTSLLKIKLKAYDHKLLDQSVAKIIEQAEATGAKVKGPIPIPTQKTIYTVIRAVHKYKDSREQFEMRTHKRLIQLENVSKDTEGALERINIPAGVFMEVKI